MPAPRSPFREGPASRSAKPLRSPMRPPARTPSSSTRASSGTIRLTACGGTLQVTEALTIDGDIDDDGCRRHPHHRRQERRRHDGRRDRHHRPRRFAGRGQARRQCADLRCDGQPDARRPHPDRRRGQGRAAAVRYAQPHSVTLTNSTVIGNRASDDGGGILSTSTVTLIDSTVSGNSAGSDGGGVAADTAILTNSTISGNSAVIDDGGGLAVTGTATLTNSTVSGNNAGSDGGGIAAEYRHTSSTRPSAATKPPRTAAASMPTPPSISPTQSSSATMRRPTTKFQ